MALTAPGALFRATLLLLAHHAVLAELPLHCSMEDASGDWQFFVSDAQPIKNRLPECGHSIPGKVKAALKIDAEAVVPSAGATKLDVTLSEEISFSPRRHLRAFQGTEKEGRTEGTWTMVADEGFEVRVGNRSLFAHFHFSTLNTSKKAHNGDDWEKIGQFFGRRKSEGLLKPLGQIYACSCDKTSTGWWHRETADGGLEGGCFWGTRKSLGNPHNKTPITTLISLRADRHEAAAEVNKRARLRGGAAAQQLALLETERAAPGWGLVASEKLVFRPGGAPPQPRSASFLQDVTVHHDGSTGGDGAPDTLPESFDWREELKDMPVCPNQDVLGTAFNQGQCGSCYAFAGIMALQMRFRAQLYRRHSLLYPLRLSYKSATRCSPYTEGCAGGFTYLTYRFSKEVGVPLQDCDKEDLESDLDNKCDWKCHGKDAQLFYAKDYSHVGGFSYGASEKRIMSEIYHNGPVQISFTTDGLPEFITDKGVSKSNHSNGVMTLVKRKKMKTEEYSTNTDVNEWVHTTHAILAVGWGEEPPKAPRTTPLKYWLVRNSWGIEWGTKGYAKILRGKNTAGVEADAVVVQPDLSRLPKGFLAAAKKESRQLQKNIMHTDQTHYCDDAASDDGAWMSIG